MTFTSTYFASIITFYQLAFGVVLVGAFLAVGFYFGNVSLFSKVRLPYECGFYPFVDTRRKAKTRFYIVGLLFLLFDYEIQLLLPWSMTIHEQNMQSYLSILYFLFLLTIGYVYEWIHGGLDFLDTNNVMLVNVPLKK